MNPQSRVKRGPRRGRQLIQIVKNSIINVRKVSGRLEKIPIYLRFMILTRPRLTPLTFILARLINIMRQTIIPRPLSVFLSTRTFGRFRLTPKFQFMVRLKLMVLFLIMGVDLLELVSVISTRNRRCCFLALTVACRWQFR